MVTARLRSTPFVSVSSSYGPQTPFKTTLCCAFTLLATENDAATSRIEKKQVTATRAERASQPVFTAVTSVSAKTILSSQAQTLHEALRVRGATDLPLASEKIISVGTKSGTLQIGPVTPYIEPRISLRIGDPQRSQLCQYSVLLPRRPMPSRTRGLRARRTDIEHRQQHRRIDRAPARIVDFITSRCRAIGTRYRDQPFDHGDRNSCNLAGFLALSGSGVQKEPRDSYAHPRRRAGISTYARIQFRLNGCASRQLEGSRPSCRGKVC